MYWVMYLKVSEDLVKYMSDINERQLAFDSGQFNAQLFIFL